MDFALVFCLLGNIHMQDWKWIEIRIRCTFRNDFKPLLCTDVNWILTLKCQIFWGGPKVEDFLSMNESESCLTRPRSNCCAGISTPLLYLCDMLKVWQSCSTCWFPNKCTVNWFDYRIADDFNRQNKMIISTVSTPLLCICDMLKVAHNVIEIADSE